MTIDQIIQSRAKFKKGDSVFIEGLTWKIKGFAYAIQDDELIYLLERHDYSQPKLVSEKELQNI